MAVYDAAEGTQEEAAKRFKVSLGMVKKLLTEQARTVDLCPRYRNCDRKG